MASNHGGLNFTLVSPLTKYVLPNYLSENDIIDPFSPLDTLKCP